MSYSPDSQAIGGFLGIDLSREAAPDATTLCKFHRLLEHNGPRQRFFEEALRRRSIPKNKSIGRGCLLIRSGWALAAGPPCAVRPRAVLGRAAGDL